MRIIISVVVFLIATIAYAQTPTPDPNALDIGVYQFTDLSSPQIELVGIDWSLRTKGEQSGLGNDDIGETLTFHVTAAADYMIIYRYTWIAGADAGSWQVCVDLTCSTVYDRSGGGIEPVAIQLYETNSEVVITTLENEEVVFFTIILIQSEIVGISTPTAISSTTTTVIYVPVIATPATETTYYIEATDEVTGEPIYTRYDNAMTPQSELLGYLLPMILIVLISILGVLIWKR